jgi:hypothetical protein
MPDVGLTADEKALGTVADAKPRWALVFSEGDVERIVAVRLAQVTAERDRWQRLALQNHDPECYVAWAVEDAVRALADEWETMPQAVNVNRVRDLRAVLPPSGDGA